MSIISTLRRILNDTAGTATNIDYNFQVLEDYVNTALVAVDGSNGMSGPLVVGPPVADNHAATKGYVDNLWFPGFITEYGGDVAPAGWELCQGGSRSSTDPLYVDLFAVIAYKYGDAGGGNFKLPDFRGKVAVGLDSGEPAFTPLGKTGGQRNSELLQHLHSVPAHNHTGTTSTADTQHQHQFGGTTDGAGAHNHNIGGGSLLYYVLGGQGEGFTPSGSAGRSGSWAEAGNHTHTFNGITAYNYFEGGRYHNHTFTTDNKAAFNTENTGAGTTLVDKNLQPYVVVNRIIKL